MTLGNLIADRVIFGACLRRWVSAQLGKKICSAVDGTAHWTAPGEPPGAALLFPLLPVELSYLAAPPAGLAKNTTKQDNGELICLQSSYH